MEPSIGDEGGLAAGGKDRGQAAKKCAEDRRIHLPRWMNLRIQRQGTTLEAEGSPELPGRRGESRRVNEDNRMRIPSEQPVGKHLVQSGKSTMDRAVPEQAVHRLYPVLI